MEVQGFGRRRAGALGRVHAGVRGCDHGDLDRVGTLVRHPRRSQARHAGDRRAPPRRDDPRAWSVLARGLRQGPGGERPSAQAPRGREGLGISGQSGTRAGLSASMRASLPVAVPARTRTTCSPRQDPDRSSVPNHDREAVVDRGCPLRPIAAGRFNVLGAMHGWEAPGGREWWTRNAPDPGTSDPVGGHAVGVGGSMAEAFAWGAIGASALLIGALVSYTFAPSRR